VIVESVDIKVSAFRSLYEAYGDEVVEKVLHHHHTHGGISRVVKIRECHRMFLGVELNDDEVAELAGRYAGLVEDTVVACDEVTGASAFLSENAGRQPMYVVSGTPEDELRRIIERRAIGHFFDAVYGSPKRKEAIVDDVLARHGAAPSQAVFVGDTMTDYLAARATEVPFVGRVDPRHENPFPVEIVTIPDISKLAEVIDGD